MPAPPKKDEKQDAFMGRCISHYVKKEGRKQPQAIAMCFSMWRKAHPGSAPPPKKKSESEYDITEVMDDGMLFSALTKYFDLEKEE